MTSQQPGQQIITIHALSYFSRRKGNQTTEFGQLTEYNMKNNFLEKLYSKYDRRTSPRLFYKKPN